MIKNFVKHFLGSIRCHLNGIECSRGVYIGKNVRVVNGKNVTLGKMFPSVRIATYLQEPRCSLEITAI